MTDLAALISELDAVATASADVSWDKIVDACRVLIAKAMLSGGVVSYTTNGRSVTHSITELREILKMAEGRSKKNGGGIIRQLGEFGGYAE